MPGAGTVRPGWRLVRGGGSARRPGGPARIALALPIALVAWTGAWADDITLHIAAGPSAGEVTLTWSGTGVYFEVFRSTDPSSVTAPANLIGLTAGTLFNDTPPAASIDYYVVAPTYCGNGVRDPGEQCDDGNTADLDGCSSSCTFDQAQRPIVFKMQFAADAICTRDALGEAFANATAQNDLQSSIDSGVADGSFSLVLAAIGPHDLSGTNDPSFSIGALIGHPQTTGAWATYNGTSDLDWWYAIDPGTIDAARQPLYNLPASIASKALSAGPGPILLPPLFGATTPTRLASATLTIAVGGSSTPVASINGGPPGHVPTENLDPALQSYATCGSSVSAGRLCGGVTARSLASAPLPSALLPDCAGYTGTNSMLDLIVSGCTHFLLGTLVKATQPDAADPSVPAAGAGGPYRLIANSQKVVTVCQDKNRQTVDLATCLASAAYSSDFAIATDRVIPK